MHREVQEAAELLGEMIREDPDYRAFLDLTEKLEQNPELAEQVQIFRKKNYEFQNSAEDPEGRFRELETEYQRLMRDPLAGAYLEAEAGVCRMLQEVMGRIYSEIRIPQL